MSQEEQFAPAHAPSSAHSGAARADAGKMGLAALVCVIYLTVSGGAYGTEDAIRIAGPRLTLLLCLIVPLTLSLPTALMAAELTALMPAEGGFYFWVKEAFGPFAGFAEAWLTLLYTAVDTAIYPVLFAAYLSFLIALGAAAQAICAVALIWLSGLLNFLGIRPVGHTSIVLTVALLAPFAALVAIGFPHLIHFRMPSRPLFGADALGELGAGLTVIIWNFGGWENQAVVAGEIADPRRNYLRAIAIALPLVVLGYLLPMGAALSGAHDTSSWRLGWFAQAGYRIGGFYLGAALAIGGAVSAFAVFGAALLWVSRMPFVLARERYLPSALAALSARRATPVRSIVACCVVFTLLVPLGFVALVVLDVFFYMGALVLEMGALLMLRRLYPRRPGQFMIGGGKVGLALTAALPILTWIATFGLAVSRSGGRTDFLIALGLLLTTWPAYFLLRGLYGGPVESAAPLARRGAIS